MADDQLICQLEQALRQASSAVDIGPPTEALPSGRPLLTDGFWQMSLPVLGCSLRCGADVPGAREQIGLAAALAEALVRREGSPQDHLRRQLEGEVPAELPPGDRRVLALRMLDGSPVQPLRDMLPLEDRDVLVFAQPDLAALIKDVSDMREDAAFTEYVQALRDTLLSEAGCELALGVSAFFRETEVLPDAWRQAKQALALGMRLHPQEQVFFWHRMVVERLLDELTPQQKADYQGILFNRKTARFFDEEILRTIETFLNTDLNLSDTARQLFIHRNTLVYRLDRIQQLTGLDLRRFNDAMTFRILLYLHDSDPAQGDHKNRRIKP